MDLLESKVAVALLRDAVIGITEWAFSGGEASEAPEPSVATPSYTVGQELAHVRLRLQMWKRKSESRRPTNNENP
jgi:hypothetical protein